MFKVLINSVILFVLLLVNMALFTWCINQLLGQTPIKKTLISNVQAKATPHAPTGIIQRREIIAHRSKRSLKYPAPKLHQGKPFQRLELKFRSIHIRLNKTERFKFERRLRRLDINSSHFVQIFSGAALSENNTPSPHIAKLRAQNVARIIYPYTQTIKIYYRPTMAEGKVIVEFFEPSAPKIENEN
ncbi:MAG TPA: hypothetical protein ENG03_08960 [Thioploca sp.]|nr:hypothetical protein [Thioploca sp.]